VAEHTPFGLNRGSPFLTVSLGVLETRFLVVSKYVCAASNRDEQREYRQCPEVPALRAARDGRERRGYADADSEQK
jgi:hypothetical protein